MTCRIRLTVRTGDAPKLWRLLAGALLTAALHLVVRWFAE
jgi:hypothetical protein